MQCNHPTHSLASYRCTDLVPFVAQHDGRALPQGGMALAFIAPHALNTSVHSVGDSMVPPLAAYVAEVTRLMAKGPCRTEREALALHEAGKRLFARKCQANLEDRPHSPADASSQSEQRWCSSYRAVVFRMGAYACAAGGRRGMGCAT